MKTKIDKTVSEHLPFLQTLESVNELTMWKLSVLGLLMPKDHAYLAEVLRVNGIDIDKLSGSNDSTISLDQHQADMKKYEEKVNKWNSENTL